MLNFIRERVELWKFQRTPIAQAIRAHTAEYFSLPSLSRTTDENRERIVGDFCRKLGVIYSSPNPVLACRETLAEYALLFAKLQVLALTEAEKADMFYSDNPYISGQLWRHIREASDHHEELARWKWEDPELTDEDLVALANTRGALCLYYLNGLNIVRRDLRDCSDDRDWFLPFIEAVLVNEEHLLREQTGMPPLVPDKILGSLLYGGFTTYVLSGEPNPFFAWTRDFPDLYLAGEGPPPRLATSAE